MPKGNVGISPAQSQYEKDVIAQINHSAQTWAPIQQYFARSVQQNRPGLQAQEQGQVAATARAQGGLQTDAQLARDSDRGASAGSGAFLGDMAKGEAGTAGITGMGEAAAGTDADRHYLQGLQQIVSMGTADRNMAMAGLGSAAQTEQAVEQQQADTFNSKMAGYGKLIGSAVGGGVGAMGGIGGGGG